MLYLALKWQLDPYDEGGQTQHIRRAHLESGGKCWERGVAPVTGTFTQDLIITVPDAARIDSPQVKPGKLR